MFVAGFLLTLWSEGALILLGHGAITIALGCLLLTIFRARTAWVALAAAGLAVGVVLGALFLVNSSFALARCVRDQQEDRAAQGHVAPYR